MSNASIQPLNRLLKRARSLCPCLMAMTLLVAACDAREPLYVGDPEGVNRNGKPQVIVKEDDLRVDGFRIRTHQTKSTDLIPIIGTDISSQSSSDAYWNATGLQIHATQNDGAPAGAPEFIRGVEVWVRPGIDHGKHRDCDAAGLARHRESTQLSLDSLDRFEKENRFPRDEEARQRVLNRRCSMAGNTPENAFSGYFEVDGMPIGPNMSLKEIQARRKKLGLQPLYMNSSPQIYLAPKHKTGFESDQTWYFEVKTDVDGVVMDQRLRSISVP